MEVTKGTKVLGEGIRGEKIFQTGGRAVNKCHVTPMTRKGFMRRGGTKMQDVTVQTNVRQPKRVESWQRAMPT